MAGASPWPAPPPFALTPPFAAPPTLLELAERVQALRQERQDYWHDPERVGGASRVIRAILGMKDDGGEGPSRLLPLLKRTDEWHCIGGELGVSVLARIVDEPTSLYRTGESDSEALHGSTRHGQGGLEGR